MGNEFHGLDFECIGSNLVPSGEGFSTDTGNFGCTVQGSAAGETFVGGDAYVRRPPWLLFFPLPSASS